MSFFKQSNIFFTRKLNRQCVFIFLEYFLIFLLTLFVNLIVLTLNLDEIWNYGFSYSIAQGLVPYRDFNMVVFPFYPMLQAFVMSLFGKNFFVFHLVNSFIAVGIFSFLKKLAGRAYYFIYAIFLLYSMPTYTMLCLWFCLLLMHLEEKETTSPYWIGFLVGLTFFTKQNVGLFFLFSMLCRQDKVHGRKRFIGFLIPLLFFVLYFVVTDSLMSCINYTILGLTEFQSQNQFMNGSIIFLVFLAVFLLYSIFYKKNNSPVYFYALSFLFVAYPIFDLYHVVLASIPTFVLLFRPVPLALSFERISFYLFVFILFCVPLYQIGKQELHFPNQTETFRYRAIDPGVETATIVVANYFNMQKHKTIYFLDANAYLAKLEAHMTINQFDLINRGNMGKDGVNQYIKKIDAHCQRHSCLIFLDKNLIKHHSIRDQTSFELLEYIVDHYEETGAYFYLSTYET